MNLLQSDVGKRWKWNKFGPIYERCFVFMVLVKFSANQVGKRWKWNKFGPICDRCFVFKVLVKFSANQVGKRWNEINLDLFMNVVSCLRF